LEFTPPGRQGVKRLHGGFDADRVDLDFGGFPVEGHF
jgi:hypothetical protein